MMLLQEYLKDWFENQIDFSVTLSTKVSYETIIYKHIIRYLGVIEINKLGKKDIKNFYEYLLVDGKLNKKGGLSIKTVSNIHACLSSAMTSAVQDEIIDANVMLLVKKPSYHYLNEPKKEIEILSVDEQRILLKECPVNIYGTATLIALLTGLRMGELLGLKWSDISVDYTHIKIERQVNRLKNYNKTDNATSLGFFHYTKSRKNRIVYITSHIRDLLANLKSLQKNINNRYDLIFCNMDNRSKLFGTFIDPRTLSDNYHKILNELKIGRYTFHALRHTFATRSLEAGMDFKIISHLLGHASVKFTMDTYAHVLPMFCTTEMKKFEKYISLLMG